MSLQDLEVGIAEFSKEKLKLTDELAARDKVRSTGCTSKSC